MKLDQALKLYISLYVLCFMLTWLVSIPMLVHVMPHQECLLFVQRTIEYGPAGACTFVGIAPILVAVATVVLIILHSIQLRNLKAFFRKPGSHRSSEYQGRPPHIFWRIVVFHGIITGIVLMIAAIVTAGYVATCDSLYPHVRDKLRVRHKDIGGDIGGYRQEKYDNFIGDRNVDRYSGMGSYGAFGRNIYENSITCRNILTDPQNTIELIQRHRQQASNIYSFGYQFDSGFTDVGNIRYTTYRDNTILEVAIAGSWISTVLWLIIFILMVKERHHIKAHLTDESMWGSEFGGASRRSMGSRMSNQSFDNQSNRSGSRYSGSYSNNRSRNVSNNPNRSVRSQQPLPPKDLDISNEISYIQPHFEKPLATSQPTTTTGSGSNHYVPQQQQNSLLNYFSQNPPQDEEVDIDAALNDQSLMNGQEHTTDLGNMDAPYPGLDDDSFDTKILPAYGLDQSDGLENDPIPLGDEVSMGVISRNESENYNNPTPISMPNTNRQTGRRGGRSSSQLSNGNAHHTPTTKTIFEESHRMVKRERYQVPRSTSQNQSYRTQLGNQSMI